MRDFVVLETAHSAAFAKNCSEAPADPLARHCRASLGNAGWFCHLRTNVARQLALHSLCCHLLNVGDRLPKTTRLCARTVHVG